MTTAKNKFRAVICTLLAMLLTLTMVSFPADASALTLSKSSYSLTRGYAITLKASNASGTVTWSSSDTSIATVNSSGKVVGKGTGSVVITAKSGSETAKCNVTVVGGKLLTSKDEVSLEVGKYKYVTVRAKGSHGLRVASNDKTIVTGGWVKPWDGDDIKLRLTGRGAGTTTVKISLTKYPDVYKTIKVTVGSNDAVLAASQNTVNTKVGETASIIIYSNDSSQVGYSFSASGVAKATEGTWKNNYCTLSIEGVKSGTTTLTIYRKDNSSVYEKIAITVGEGTYYVASSTVPTKITSTDQIYKWYNSKTYSYRYMLVPQNYDWACINSTVAGDQGTYEYYTVYETSPKKTVTTDSIMTFTAKVNSKSVTRYVLVPTGYDVPSYNTTVADYTGEYSYWTIYNSDVSSHKLTTYDTVKSWTVTLNNKTVTRYILLPYGYDETKLNSIISADQGTANGYYAASLTVPTKSVSTDEILSYSGTVNNKTVVIYILVPNGYDQAKVNDAKAAYFNTYEYWTVYTAIPTKLTSYDTVKSWVKTVNGKSTTRYMLLPIGYSEDMYNQKVSEDLNAVSKSYYSVTTSYPGILASGDTVCTWYNEGAKAYKYMLLPAGFDVLKRNDAIYKDKGSYDYYMLYSNPPSTKATGDSIMTTMYNGNICYMLIPQVADQDKISQGLQGLLNIS